LKKPITKRAEGMTQGVGPEFKSQYLKEKKKKEKDKPTFCPLFSPHLLRRKARATKLSLITVNGANWLPLVPFKEVLPP
jgi:hypothetical protein